MNTTRLFALIDKEWLDALKQRYILYLLILMPILFVIIPTVSLAIPRLTPMSLEDAMQEMEELPPGWKNLGWEGARPEEILQVALAGQFTLFFLIVPLAIPMTIATYSVIGEKRDRSLEPLLATPLSVFELLLGKSLAAAAPGVAITWVSAALFALFARILALSDDVFVRIVTSSWLLMVVVVAPLLTILATTVGLMVSSRVTDPRAAEQLGMIVVIPVLGLFFGQMAGVISMGDAFVLLLALGLIVIDVILLSLAVGLFQRETILTRWK
jgi:ABC-2 type transport system permease protein